MGKVYGEITLLRLPGNWQRRREIGKKLAEELGIECYDSRLIEMAAEYGEIDPAILKQAEEKKASSLLYTVYHEMANEKTGYGLPSQ